MLFHYREKCQLLYYCDFMAEGEQPEFKKFWSTLAVCHCLPEAMGDHWGVRVGLMEESLM